MNKIKNMQNNEMLIYNTKCRHRVNEEDGHIVYHIGNKSIDAYSWVEVSNLMVGDVVLQIKAELINNVRNGEDIV